MSKIKFSIFLLWFIGFFLISFFQTKEKTWGILIAAIIISALISYFATHYFFKSINKKMEKNEDMVLEVPSDEIVYYRNNANLKQFFFLFLGGVLFMTDKHIYFIHTEFDRNKEIMKLDIDDISEVILKKMNRIAILTKNDKKYQLIVNNNSHFYDEYFLIKNKL